jgi:hypothetical protein
LEEAKEAKDVAERKQAERKSLLFKGPTVVAAIVCFVSGVFSIGIGFIALFASSDLQGTLLINLSNGHSISGGLLDLVGATTIGLGIAYFVAGILLWTKKYWISGIYFGIMISIVGMVASGLGTTFAPGLAAAGMIINVLIVTLLATETWEESRDME